ncbi:inactive pancreatic lipase-related protein 1 [Parasteatoda tepidariorum]|uniref:inactive pancreatic lipase-related protein 1 n=1 Tax=Parasteatoda tepidariorum TaxID=114398 RepID=UPI00077FE2CF|nr:inactive pancreatic lipase-related protein 1 [Parasteatoda tepidariorum]
MILLVIFILIFSTCAQQVEREREVTTGQQIDAEKDSLLTRCFDRWGCLSIGEPFFSSLRPISLFPIHPDALDPQFLLVTRSAPDIFQKIRVGNNSSFSQSFFDPLRPVKIILHGFRESGYQDWIKDLIRELLTADDYNIISVDWRLGAAQSYPQAAANTRSLGLVVADFIDHLQRKYRIPPSDIHLIGYNLGAHAAGYVGDQIPRIGRITGLDPAGPYFEDTDPRVRLDPDDAVFVDVIHTDSPPSAQVAGMLQPAGHLDFYPTPGWRRTGCNMLEGIKSFRRCKAVHAPELFTESVNMDCPFYGYKCDSYANFSSGQCDRGCGSDMSQCASMGFKAEEWLRYTSSEPVTMFLETSLEEPFCRYHYHFNVLLSDKEESRRYRNETGLLFVRLAGTKGHTALLQATPRPVVFARGNALEFLISAGNLGRLLRVDVLWTSLHPRPLIDNVPSIFIHSVRITNLETTYREVFCGSEDPITPEHIKVFFRGGVC